MLRSSLMLCSFVLLPMGASADELKATPYRPTVSNPADLPVPRHLEWEAGALTMQGREDDRHTSVPFLLKYAFNENLGLLVGGESFVSDHVPGNTTTGWGDTSVTLKARHEVTESTALGLEAGVKVPTASQSLGSGRADFTLNGIVSTQVRACDVDVNVSYTRTGVADAGTSRNVLGWAVAASRSITDQWTVEGEFSGVEQRGAANQAQFLGAVSYAAEPTVVLDVGALVGLDDAAPRYGVFAGLVVLVR